jgi:methylenetetrahydrofolate reductase (NADPH)
MRGSISFEFFPPKTDEGREKLRALRRELARFQPEYMSVTFGAGGSTQAGTLETVTEIQQSGIAAAPHLSCIGADKATIRELLHTYQERGIGRIVALRGDMPSGSMDMGDFGYANELVSFIRAETDDAFYLEVAAYPETHPQARDFMHDFANFKRKVEAGASSAITQYFYNADAYYAFMEACAKSQIDIPIVPGIMPISNYVQLARFSNMCGAEIPRWIATRLAAFGDDLESVREFGLEVVTRLCENLLDLGAPGLHFYTMNRAEPSVTILQNLGVKPS